MTSFFSVYNYLYLIAVLITFYFMIVPAGEYVLASVAENFEKKVLKGRVKLEIPLGATEVGLISIVDAGQRQGRVKTGECGRLFPGLEMKVGVILLFIPSLHLLSLSHKITSKSTKVSEKSFSC